MVIDKLEQFQVMYGLVYGMHFEESLSAVCVLCCSLVAAALEQFLTRTPWYVIPIVWVPVASWFISNSVKMGTPSPTVALLVLLGIFFWTLAEYLLHRFLFHVRTTSYWFESLFFHRPLFYVLLTCITFTIKMVVKIENSNVSCN